MALTNSREDEEEGTRVVPTAAGLVTYNVPAKYEWQWRKGHLVLDLAVVVGLLVIYAAIENADVRNVYMVKETLYKHSYPHRPNSVPSWSVPLYTIGVPLLTFIGWKVFARNRVVSWYDSYRVWIAQLFALFLTAAITNALKDAIGRPRPNFLFQCWPDGNPVFSDGTIYGGFPVCQDPANAKEYHKSFPSGHSSWSAAGLGFLTYFLIGQLHTFQGKGRSWTFLVCLIPSLLAIVVGVTRITDYWHNVSDVCFGLALGFFIAFVVYLQVFPWFAHPSCHVPRYVIINQARARRESEAAVPPV